MPSLQFANLGETPSTPHVSVAGNLYFFSTDDSPIALVFDTRRYRNHVPEELTRVRFRKFGPIQVAVLPKLTGLEVNPYGDERHPIASRLKKIREVYSINLTEEPPLVIGWRRLRWLFPKRHIRIPMGTTHWAPSHEAQEFQSAFRSLEQLGFKKDEKMRVESFTLYLFRRIRDGSKSVLVVGNEESYPFAFFLGEESLRELFPTDRVSAEPNEFRTLSAGKWHAFYPAVESPPIK